MGLVDKKWKKFYKKSKIARICNIFIRKLIDILLMFASLSISWKFKREKLIQNAEG